MKRKPLLSLLLALLASMAGSAHADAYKCVAANGHVTYQDWPCTDADALAVLAEKRAEKDGQKIVRRSALSEFALARRDYKTAIRMPRSGQGPAPRPPADVLDFVKYPSAVGALGAYVTPDPKDGRRHPAIVWITGGDCNSIGDVWSPAQPANDQTASAFRDAGVAMMYPSLRGGNDNPGAREALYGEIDDVLAAADWLSRQSWVDPARIYLGGHSTGGTLALLTAEQSARFKAVFSFGAVGRVSNYVRDLMPVDWQRVEQRESTLRTPIAWLTSIRSPVFLLEGEGQGNIDELRAMRVKNSNPQITFVSVPRANHFTILAPATRLLAAKIIADDGSPGALAISAQEIVDSMR